MTVDRIAWLREAVQPISYRRMYGLVVLIIANPTATIAEKRMAQYIGTLLKDVMGLAVASGTVLTKARIGFGHLTELVVAAECQQAA